MSRHQQGQAKDNSGTWYLAQAADGVWRIQAHVQAELADLYTIEVMSRYPAVIAESGQVFHLGTSPLQLIRSRLH